MFVIPRRLTDALARVGLVGDGQLGHVSSYLVRYLARREAHGLHVVRPQTQRVVGHHQELGDRAQTVVDVHHRQARVGAQEAVVVTVAQRVVEDLARVVCIRVGRKKGKQQAHTQLPSVGYRS